MTISSHLLILNSSACVQFYFHSYFYSILAFLAITIYETNKQND